MAIHDAVAPSVPTPTAEPAPRSRARWLVIAVPYLWLLVLFLVPFIIVLKISFSTTAVAQPPYVPTFDLGRGCPGSSTASSS